MGTAAENGCNQSANGSVAAKAQKTTGEQKSHHEARCRAGRALRAMRRCLILRQGAKPPETPPPFPRAPMISEGAFLSRVRCAGETSRRP